MPAPGMGESPMRPGTVPRTPPVDTATASRPAESRATAPTVSAPAWRSWRLRLLMKTEGSQISTPWSRAKRDAPEPDRRTWRPSRITSMARSTGWRTSFKHATPPARSAAPSMTPASSSTSPSAFRQAPMPALRSGSSSLWRAAATPPASAPSPIPAPPRASARSTASPRCGPSAGGTGPPPPQLITRAEVDELRVLRQPGMHLTDPFEHLLRHPAVVRVTLRRGPQLAEVIDLAQVRAEVPAHAEGERHDVLRQRWPEVGQHAIVRRGGAVDRRRAPAVHPQLGETLRQGISQGGSQVLPVLGDHAVAVEVAVGGEVGDDLECALSVLEGARGPLAAIRAIREQTLEHPARARVQVLPPGVGIGKQGRRHHLSLGVWIVFEQA